MFEMYQLREDCGIPIYQQLVDYIHAQVKCGNVPVGTQLPTVRELADLLGVARGTVKRAYDELEQSGIVEKVQGRGTFVCYHPIAPQSRKERAMQEIDALFEKLQQMELPVSEISVFLNLKLRQFAAEQDNVQVAVVECNPEVLSQLTEQLHRLGNVDLFNYLLSDVETYPYKLAEDMDLIITTVAHASDLQAMIPDSKKVAKIVLRLLPHCVAQLVKLPAGLKLGMLSQSTRFGALVRSCAEEYCEGVTICEGAIFGSKAECSAYLRDKTALLVPKDFKKYCRDDILREIQSFAVRHPVIECAYQVDEGSFMYAQEKVQRLCEKKKI